ncbi:MMPL family transporter [Georgenia sp. TF02-10]|uniref:MMPL family transporter n=1 Tax=Georgenia sp. TF02-10 TaxID=2917725 RepID=UPI001FA6DB08|nr:MMPL family transporter [Georgenia sp. TF02-10]UNX55186.1 MMPL family transporter [Georgenia sp. TF02-10]
MASFLYRLGRSCARHPWRSVVAWLLVIAAVTGAALSLSKPLTSEFTIPGSRFEQVLEDLKQEIPDAAGATGTVVFSSDDGFTAEEKAAVAATEEEWKQVEGVADVVDPFAAQQQLADQAAQLESGRAELESGRAQLEEGRSQLEAGQAELDAAREQLQAQAAQLEAGRAAMPPQALAQAEQQLAAGQAQLDAGQAELDANAEDLAAAETELADGQRQLEVGGRLAELTEDTRFVSEDGTVALAQVRFVGEAVDLDPAVGEELQEIGADLPDSGVDVDYSQEIVRDISSIIGPGEVLGLVVAAVVLLVMLGGLLAAGMPMVMALVGVAVGVGGAMALSGTIEMNSTTPALALMLGLAVGIDYSLFLINRHRTQLRGGMATTDSIALATGTSGNAVTFAGLTVIIALAALVVTGIPFLAVMGLAAAATVLIAVLVALTLTPAVLSLLGERVLGRRGRRAVRDRANATEGAQAPAEHAPDGAHAHDGAHAADGARVARRGGWAGLAQRHPVLSILGVVAVGAVMAYPATDLRLGLPDGSSEPAGSTAYRTYDLTREHFGAGMNGPLIAVATLDEPIAEGETDQLAAQADLAEALAEVPGALTVVPAGVSEDRSTLAFQIVPEDGPAEESTVDLVHALDEAAPQIGAEHDAELGFTGQTVANIDISERLGDALPVYLLVVVGLSLVLLLLVFRSLLVPLLATAGFLLSVAAAFGAVVAVYQWGELGWLFSVHEPGPVLSFLPILLIGVLFGLAMDYQVFLVSAVREAHVHGSPARAAVLEGFNLNARVVTAAAIIMVSVFGGFVFAELTMIRPIGFGLAIGVLIDAFLVRMTLTPAVLSLLGERAWYLPRWLDRVLPAVDVEGSRLGRDGAAGGPLGAGNEPARASG